MFDLSRARRVSGGFNMGGAFCALDLREELRARAVVATRSLAEPDLDEEDEGENSEGKGVAEESGEDCVRTFELFPDGIPKKVKKEASSFLSSGDARECNLVDTASVGLRRRKNASEQVPVQGEEEERVDQWTEETPALTLDENDDEEGRLRRADPLELFGGLAPPALRSAQAEARRALAGYVEAANLVAEILRITVSKESQTK